MKLNTTQLNQFERDGYIILRGFMSSEQIDELLQVTKQHVSDRIEPFELEASLPYPNSPETEQSPGGDTIRRLLQAYDRHEVYKNWAICKPVSDVLKQLLNTDQLHLTRSHHNCIMTKRPEYSSDTLWHRDTRYWHFTDNELINTWLALVEERPENGGLKIIPGSYKIELRDDQLDEEMFFRDDLPDNKSQIHLAKDVHLMPGDLLLFHARSLHAASRNYTEDTKYSLVYSYHGADTKAVENSNSARLTEVVTDSVTASKN